MRNLIFSFGVVLLAFCAKTQVVFTTYAVEVGDWDDYQQQWIFNREYTRINFILQGNVIMVQDNAKSTYVCLDVIYDDGQNVSWDAFDEKNRSCVVTMATIDYEKYLIVVYSDVCYRYIYESVKNLSE